MNATSSVDSLGDRFTVMTRSKLFLFTKPNTSVIPFLINGRMTPERGFQVYYSTTDETILQEWHDRLCQEVRWGNYRGMAELVRANQSPITDMRLAQYVTGFKY